MRERRKTLLPDPVAPAISRCGSRAKSATVTSPEACRVRKFGRTSQKRLFAGKTEFGSSLHQIVARAVLI
jgi:hypothetical protein